MSMRALICAAASAVALSQDVTAFGAAQRTRPAPRSKPQIATSSPLHMAPPGGWGIPGAGGTSFRDEEFADNRGKAARKGRRGYDAYEMENRGQFMKRVREEQKGLKQRKKDDLMNIAKMAGIKTKKKEGLYGKFDESDFEEFEDDEDDLDLRVVDEK